MKPILQVALDFVDLKRAINLAEESQKGGCDWLEAGTPLIKAEGLNCIRELRKKFPKITIVADMKTMDVGRVEVEMAAKAGANIICVLGCSSIKTIKECVEAGRNYGAKIFVDMIEVKDVTGRIKEVEKLGVNYIGLHIPVDEQMSGNISFNIIKKARRETSLPLAIAGGINSENAADAVKAGADIIIVGGAITKSEDSRKATHTIKKAILERVRIKTDLYKRVGEKDVRKVLEKVSTANVSDALHRGLPLRGVNPLFQGIKLIGPVVTVRTYPGDWAKPVEAIDIAQEGEVIVIDAGGVPPAVWGELATNSAIKRKISGVVIYGGIRDIGDIRKLRFPAFYTISTPQAAEPKGFGEINIPINISGVRISPGDWIVGDDDGVMVILKDEITEFTNRAMDVLEKENRIRKEIKSGSTLASVTELLKWEKK